MTRVAGISRTPTAAEGIHLALSSLPPGCRSTPHRHVNCESAIFVTRGKGRFVMGEKQDKALEIGAGDFIYVPPGAAHTVVNDSPSEPLEMVVARNAPVEIVEELPRARLVS